MLSIEECREELGELATGKTDTEVAHIRDTLYAIVETIIDDYLDKFYGRK